MGGDSFYLKFWSKLPVAAKTPIFNGYSLVALETITISERSSINTNRKSTTSFPISLR